MAAKTSENLQLLYQGSVKRVFAAPGKQTRLWFEFSDDYSVFDWGKMPDTIVNKGRALTVLGAHFFDLFGKPEFWCGLKTSKQLAALDAQFRKRVFSSKTYEQLCARGMQHHFHQLCTGDGEPIAADAAATAAGAVYMEVDKAAVERPEQCSVLGQLVYKYPGSKQPVRLIPLEVVFRFGMPAGSSLKERLERDPAYASQLGLAGVPASNEFFSRPVVECFTKLEPKDRLLTLSEALNISTLAADQFVELGDLSLLAALALRHTFGECGIELWDGKFEFILRDGAICLADSIGPDELRLIHAGIQLSKETIRQVYRGTPWEKSLKKAQSLAADRGTADWKVICKDELQSTPDCLPAEFKSKIDHLYGVLANRVIGKPVFPGEPTLESFASSFPSEKP